MPSSHHLLFGLHFTLDISKLGGIAQKLLPQDFSHANYS